MLEKTTSQFPVSISTSYALESLFTGHLPNYDNERIPPPKINILDYNEIYININTLFRNLISAIDKELFLQLKSEELITELYSEMEFIISLFKNENQNKCTPHFYNVDYVKLKKEVDRLKYIQLRIANTKNQLLMESRTNNLIEYLKSIKLKNTHFYTDKIIPKDNSYALIITHLPYDLLSLNKFKTLELLESNTGKLKNKFQWYTKYYPIPNEDLHVLPFNRKLLLIFGDKSLIKPMDIKFRRLILDIAKNRNWTPTTTEAKVTFDLELDIKEKYLIEVYRSL